MMVKKSLVSMVIVLAIIFSLSASVFAAHPFDDVEQGSWYDEAVDYVYENGLMSGTALTNFAPERNMSRAMLVTVLYRMAGSPECDTDIPFVDVSANEYYYEPVKWCYENGIVRGVSEHTFAPDVNISREQMVTIFARYAVYMEMDISECANLNTYDDYASVSDYAVDSFGWAVAAGIINGTSATTLSPQGTATRAQCAAILQRFAKWSEIQEGGVEITPTVKPTSTPVVTVKPTPTPTPTVKPTPTPPQPGYDDTETGEDEF